LTAAQRWPESLLALIGVGNTAYELGDYRAAQHAYQNALEINPDKAEIWNNLSYALAQMDLHEPSMAAIERALELDPDNQNFRDSYNELSTWE
jgi:tetratricopeptide (TPR) repeat protein